MKVDEVKLKEVKDDNGKVIAFVDARLITMFCKKCDRSSLVYDDVQCPRCGRLQ